MRACAREQGQIPCAIMARPGNLGPRTEETRLAARILSGNAIRNEIFSGLSGEIPALAPAGIRPGLAAVLVGDDPASKIYVTNKIAASEKLGLAGFNLTPPVTITTAELLRIVEA